MDSSLISVGDENVNSSSDSGESNTSEEREYCSCKGKCFRKKGKGACKCCMNGLICHASCSCNKATCKNRTETTNRPQRKPVNPDGEEEFQEQLQLSQEEIEDFVTNLETSDKDKVLINLLNMGRGSLDFAKSILTQEPEQNPVSEEQSWCKCGVCQNMPTPEENLCCSRVRCVTCYTSFSTICLDRDVLEVVIKARCDIRADEFDFSAESFRKAGYRQFTLWKYGKLGRGNRRVLPACVVRQIRSRYPSPTGQYMGYRSS